MTPDPNSKQHGRRTWTSVGLALGDGSRLGGSGSEASTRPMKTYMEARMPVKHQTRPGHQHCHRQDHTRRPNSSYRSALLCIL